MLLLLAIQEGTLKARDWPWVLCRTLGPSRQVLFIARRRSGRRPFLRRPVRPQGLQVAEPMRERNNAITTRAPARRLLSKRPLPSSSLEPQWDLKLDDIDD